MHNYIYIPTRELWPAASVNSCVPPIPIFEKDGTPLLNKKGEQVKIPANEWLYKHRRVEQMTWAPGLPMINRDRGISDGGWEKDQGAACFNLYRPPVRKPGEASKADPWIEH